MQHPKSNKLGFTLIELLVVVAIIGLLSSMISLAVNNSRLKSRDAKRVSDLKQIKSGLDIYFSEGSGYPTTDTWDAAVGGQLTCGTKDVMRVPQDPLTPTFDYDYTASGNSNTGCGGTVQSAYTLQFYMENKAAWYDMDQDGGLLDSGGNPVSFDDLL